VPLRYDVVAFGEDPRRSEDLVAELNLKGPSKTLLRVVLVYATLFAAGGTSASAVTGAAGLIVATSNANCGVADWAKAPDHMRTAKAALPTVRIMVSFGY